MLTPYIVDLKGLRADIRQNVLAAMEHMGYTGVRIKPGTESAYMFCTEAISTDDVAKTLSVDKARVTDATGWNMNMWIFE